jgi:hypothetical protein
MEANPEASKCMAAEMTLLGKMNASETYLFWGDRLLRGLVQFLNSLRIVPEILLASNEDDGKTLTEMKNL